MPVCSNKLWGMFGGWLSFGSFFDICMSEVEGDMRCE